MNNIVVTVLQILIYITVTYGELNPYLEALRIKPWKSVQEYVEVRPGAYLFTWLYYADGTEAGADRKPLIIWIQGGPGLAATGIANFAELGPFDMNFQPRNHTWVKGRNLLLIDHPVGTGFSYVANNNKTLYAETDRQIAIDLSRAIKAVFKRHKAFRKSPTYIMGQSYGGKIAPRLAYYLHTAIERKSLQSNLKGIAIGGGWVDPRESTLIQPKFLYMMGVLDESAYKKCMYLAKRTTDHIDNHDYIQAHRTSSLLFRTINSEAGMDVNFNNINQVSPYPALDSLAIKVNKYVKPTLSHVVNQSLEWQYLSDDVWIKLQKNFLVSSVKFLELLLNTTKLKITVYNGNLDVVTPLAGASNWVHKVNWHGKNEFKFASKRPIRGFRNGFYKQVDQFSFWWVYGAGHWVPQDNPVAMEQILDHLISEPDTQV